MVLCAVQAGCSHLGVVKTKKGFGIRVPGKDFEEAVKATRPEDADRLLAQRFEVSGLPVFCGEDAVKTLIPGWKIEPVFTFRVRNTRTWIVAAQEAPMESKVQH